MYNQQRSKYERQENKTRVLTWRSEARRDPGEGSQIPTGPNPGDTGSSPRVHHTGPEVHGNRVPGNSKSSNQRFSSRLLELTLLAPSWGHATRHRFEATSYKLQAEATSNKRQAASYKLQAASYKRLK